MTGRLKPHSRQTSLESRLHRLPTGAFGSSVVCSRALPHRRHRVVPKIFSMSMGLPVRDLDWAHVHRATVAWRLTSKRAESYKSAAGERLNKAKGLGAWHRRFPYRSPPLAPIITKTQHPGVATC